MTCCRTRIRSLVAVFAILFPLGAVRADPPEVRDDAGFFSPAVVSLANTRILYLKRMFKVDFEVETYKEVPASYRAAVEADKAKGFDQWATETAGKEKLNGILVLVCKSPQHLEVSVTKLGPRKGVPRRRPRKTRQVADRQLRRQEIR